MREFRGMGVIGKSRGRSLTGENPGRGKWGILGGNDMTLIQTHTLTQRQLVSIYARRICL